MDTVQVQVHRDNGKTVVRLNGDLDGSGANQVVHALQSIQRRSRGNEIVLDLSAIQRLGYFGIATLSRFIRNYGG